MSAERLRVLIPAPTHAPTHTPMTRPRILIVEDEVGLSRSLSWYFNREGFDTHVSETGPDGLQTAQAVLPDVVLLDLMLPGLTGLDVCRALRADPPTRDIPVVMMTARAEPADRAAGYSAGADDYVTKPFSNKEVLARVKALLRRVGEDGD